ncbi:hypothetical protein [Labrys sp. WJW]|uniref:hypothetical protein n=1 Tax=Labrys sp. WJW TaxID=1737983 RepID=UPI0012E9D2EF|nr:hypothetical protein [Labrys sp. WJW]
MVRLFYLVLLIGGAFWCASFSNFPQSTQFSDTLPNGRNAFTVTLPMGFVLEERRIRFIDFQIFDVKLDNKPYVSIYVGNAPYIDDKKKEDFQAVLTTKYVWPRKIHVWTRNVGAEKLNIVTRIAASVKAR